MALLDDINQKIALIGECVDDIGEAANVKGAGIDLEYDKLNKWAEKILAMAVPVYKIENTSAAEAKDAIAGDVFVYPTQSESGVTPTRSININNGTTYYLSLPLYLFKDVTIPEYFETVTLDGYGSGPFTSSSTAPPTYVLEKLTIEGRIITDYMYNFRSLNHISFPNVVENNGIRLQAVIIAPTAQTTNKLHVDAPNAIGSLAIGFVPSTSSTTPTYRKSVELTVNAPHITSLGTPASLTATNPVSVGFKGFKGTIVLPSLTTLNTIWLPMMQQDTMNIRMPNLTTVNFSNSANAINLNLTYFSGTTHLYVGPNVTSFGTLSSTYTAAFASNVIVHIPAGDSTTKTTISNSSYTINYVQDYDYTADLLEE